MANPTEPQRGATIAGPVGYADIVLGGHLECQDARHPYVVEVYTNSGWFANDYPATTVAHAVAIALREVGLTTSTTDAR